jgi:phosphoglycolate phosphatase
LAVHSVSLLLEEHRLPPISEEYYREHFGFPVADFYKKLGFDLQSPTFDYLCERFHHEYDLARLDRGKLFDDVVEHLDFFSKSKKQSILSAGAQWHLNEWVNQHQLAHFFDHIFGIDNLQASSKVDRGLELIEISKSSKKNTILIGDTDHDLEVGQEIGIDVLLIANGHQSYERLSIVHDNVIECRFQ